MRNYLRLLLLVPMLGRLMLADTAPDGGQGQQGGTTGGTGGTGGGQTPPPVQFTPEQQAHIDQLVEGRLARDRQSRPAAPANLAELQQKAAQLDQVLAASRTDQQRAADEAKAAGLTEGRRAVMPMLVAAELRAASGGQLTAEQVTALTAPLSPDYFVGTDGNVDPAKVSAWVGGIPGLAPQQGQGGAQGAAGGQGGAQGQQGQGGAQGGAQGAGQGQQQQGQQQGGQQWPGMGQGQRGGTAPTGKDAGLAEARRRFGDKSAQQGQQSA